MLNPGYSLSAMLTLERYVPNRFADSLDERIDARLREEYRRWIVRIPPQPVAAQSPQAQIHQLLGHRHVGMGLWSLASLVGTAGCALGVVIHDDGTLTDADRALIERQLPGVRIISRSEADARVRGLLAAYPACTGYRFGNVAVSNHRGQSYNMFIMALILFDINLLADCDKVIVLDADVLFFQRPDDLVRWATDPADTRTLYSVEGFKATLGPDRRLSFSPKAAQTLNSGLLCLNRPAVFVLDRIEEWIAANQDLMYTSPVFEQLCYSYLIKTRSDSQALDAKRYGFNYTDADSVATHFGVKRFFYFNLRRAAEVLGGGSPADPQ